MAAAASKATSLTFLTIGAVNVPIALFSTVAKPGKTPEGFTTAGPNGGVLKARPVARPVPIGEPRDELEAPAHSDPLATLSEPGDSVTLPPQTVGEPLARIDQGRDIAQPRTEIFGIPVSDEEIVNPQKFAERLERMETMGYPTSDQLPGGLAGAARPEAAASWTEPSAVDGEYGRELVEEGTGDVVRPEDVRRGVRLADGRFIDCTTQLVEIDERTKLDTADVVAFVDATKIPRARVKASYYIGTDDPKAPHALRIVFEGLRRSRRAAVVKLTKRSRQTLGAIVPYRDALVLLELVFAEDVRPAPRRALRHLEAEVDPVEVARFCELVDAFARPPWVMDELRDDAIALREELFARALAGAVPETLVPPRPRAEQDVLAQLEASLAAVSA